MTLVQQKMNIYDNDVNSRDFKPTFGKDKHPQLNKTIKQGNISVSAMCSRLLKRGINIGRNQMFKWLRDNGYISKQKSTWNMPLKKYEALNILATKETFVFIADEQVAKYTPLITPKGALHIEEIFISPKGANEKASL